MVGVLLLLPVMLPWSGSFIFLGQCSGFEGGAAFLDLEDLEEQLGEIA